MHVGFRSTNKFTFDFWSNGVNSNATISDSNWHHYVATYNATTNLQSIYIDGVLDNTRTATSDFLGSGLINLGRVSTFGYFDGNLDDLRIWNYQLTATEISTRYNCELNGNENGLIAYYKFNQGTNGINNNSTSNLFDSVTNTENGSLTNFALSGTTSNWVSDFGVATGTTCSEPTPTPTVSNQTFCSGATVANLVATGTGTFNWYNVSTGGTALPNTHLLLSATYYVSQTINGNESARVSFQVTINETPTPPTASAQAFCSNANPTVADLVASGTNLSWYASATGGSALASSTALTSGTYFVSQTVNGCESTRTSVAVTVTSVTAPTASAQAFCSNANPTIADLVATGTNISWYASATGGSALASSTALASGTYFVSQTVNGCESNRTSVAVTVTSVSDPTASAQAFCSNTNPTIADLVASGTNLSWYATATGGSALTSSTALTSGTYFVSQTVNGCESTRTSVAVTVTSVTAPTASAQAFCSNANPTIADLVASGTNLSWYATATGGSALTSSTALASGTYFVSQTVNGCESNRTSVAVTVTAVSAPTASAQAFCSNANPTVADLVATGTNLSWYASATGGSALASSTALTSGTYFVSQTVNGCESTRTSVAVTVTAVSAPTASAQAFCSNASPTVADLVASGTNLSWYATATGGSALASSTALTSGTYFVSQTVNGCESTRTSVAVTVTAVSAPTASAQAFCSNTNPTVADLVASGTNLSWYASATGGSPLASSTALTSGTYFVSQTVNGCESNRTSVAVTVTTASAPTASAQAFCSNANPTVADLVASGTNLSWYASATGGSALTSSTALTSGTYFVSQTVNGCESNRTSVAVTVTSVSDPTASAQAFCSNANPTVADLVASGTNLSWYASATGGSALASSTALTSGTYFVSQTVNGCESNRTSVAVTVTAVSAPTASAQAFCSNTNPTVADLVASGTNLSWYASATGGSPLASSTALTSGTYFVSQTVNGCESNRTSVAVTVTTASAPTASAQAFCSNANPTVADLVASGTNLSWYASATGGSALTSSTALTSGTYFVSQTVNGCESNRTSVAVTVTSVSDPTASAQAFCSNANPTVADLVASGTNLSWYASATGGSALASSTALTSGTYFVSQTVNGCESNRTSVAVTVTAVSAPTASAQAFCSNANPTVADLVATGTNLSWYASATGGSALASSTVLTSGTYFVSQTVNGCESSRTSVAVTLTTASAPTASAQAFCSNTNPTIADLVASGTNLSWYTSATGGSALTSSTVLTSGTYFVSQTVNGCESNRTSVAVTLNDLDTTITENNGTLTVAQTEADYQWYQCPEILLDGETDQSFTPDLSGDYKVIVSKNGCIEISDCITVNVLDNENFEGLRLNIYPNPTKDYLNIYSNYNEEMSIEVADMFGKNIQNIKSNSSFLKLNMVNYSGGVYVLKIKINDKIIIKKIMKE
ncbi:Ig-like domain-containing protein [Flavobacterium piscinae]|uniref:Ig-like domain-containing protein n=1 Tax=Flavobacterium piscinae TaxID=2506424 RepID=UPI002AAB1038|nr:LamG-like jellyroll fold domain-containing protein [Flavobacterium piscinae]